MYDENNLGVCHKTINKDNIHYKSTWPIYVQTLFLDSHAQHLKQRHVNTCTGVYNTLPEIRWKKLNNCSTEWSRYMLLTSNHLPLRVVCSNPSSDHGFPCEK